MDQKRFNPELFKLVREEQGLSQKELAQKLGIQQSSVCKYEAGDMIPTTEIINDMSKYFGYQEDFFFQDVFPVYSGLVFHRKRASLSAKDRTKLEAEARLRAMDVLYLFKRKGLKSNIIPRENREPEIIAQVLRKHWRVNDGPIDNVTKLLEDNNIAILSFDFATEELDGFVLNVNNIVCIALNSNSCFSPDRRRFTLCHELAHDLLHQNVFPDKTTEKEADRFAAEFLAPQNAIESDLAQTLTFERLQQLKHTWKMSMASLVVRAHTIGKLSDVSYHRIMMYMSSKGLRKHEPECGLVPEIPCLLNNMLQEFFAETQDALSRLKLSESRFKDRYPEIIGGLSEMSVGKA